MTVKLREPSNRPISSRLAEDLHRFDWHVAVLFVVVALAAVAWHFGRPRRG